MVTITVLYFLFSTTIVNLHTVQAATGANFLPSKQIFSSYSSWTVSLSLDFQPYYDHLSSLNETISGINNEAAPATCLGYARFYCTHWLALIREASEAFFDENMDIISKLDEIVNLMTIPEQTGFQKRSLLPIVGDIFSSLFGVATESNLHILKTQIGNLRATQGQVVHVVSNSLSILNKTNVVVKTNRDMINNLTSATNDIITQIQTVRDHLDFYSHMNAAIIKP